MNNFWTTPSQLLDNSSVTYGQLISNSWTTYGLLMEDLEFTPKGISAKGLLEPKAMD
jgi:hypothetical protein